MKATLPSIRVKMKAKTNLESALEKFNKNNIVAVSMLQFRRLAYEYLSQTILQGKELDIKLIQM